MIVGMSSAKLQVAEICYVDCFAGPWSDESEDLSGTSISVSLQILDKCRQALGRRGIRVKFRALYVERDKLTFNRLKKHIQERTPSGVHAAVLEGDFVELRDKILSWCGSGPFVFFFIDPTGWKEVGVKVLQPLLQRPRSEFLINFMYDFVNRTASMAEWREDIASLLGETVDLGDLPGSERERLLLSTYQKNLKRHLITDGRWVARSAYVRVLDRKKERPKYHLVYLTSHPRGIIAFMEISEELDLVQKAVRASTKEHARAEKSGISDLFGAAGYIDAEQGHAKMSDVEGYWLRYLEDGPKRVGEERFADLLEATGWFPGDFQRGLGNLINTGKVRNLDALKKRPKNPLHWKKDGERLELTGDTK